MNEDIKDIEKHESYGMLSFSRYSGGDDTFFGSSIKQSGGIEMELTEGSIEHKYHRDWFHSKKTLCRIRMTQSQFAELITHMNCSPGVPVTISMFNGKKMENPPFSNKRLQFEDDFRKEMKDLTDKLEKLTSNTKNILSSKKALTKSEKENILLEIRMLEQEISANIPFIQKSFNEQMDKTVQEAKGEIECHIATSINKLGIEKINDLKSLSTTTK